MQVLTGPLLKEMILESYNRINDKVDYLNDINVFPVPDGDTGLNLYITMGKVVEELEKHDNNLTIKQAAKSIAKGAFVGAKGNSGVILSQFFVGFAKVIENEIEITLDIFAKALIEGSNKAYNAVMNPREGTILSVLRETAEAAVIKSEEGGSWKEVIEYCYETAQKSTLNTPNLLEDLKNAGVVDAGALGFVYLIQGWLFVITNTLDGPKFIDLRSDLENLHNQIDIDKTLHKVKYKYCTEALLINSMANVDELKSKMSSLGDSLLIIENEKSLKLHIHSNKPREILKLFSSFGKLHAIKVDDMSSQSIISHDN